MKESVNIEEFQIIHTILMITESSKQCPAPDYKEYNFNFLAYISRMEYSPII